MSQTITTEALVLHCIRWSESSKIVNLFIRDAGIIKAIAKGALRPKSPFRGVLEALNYVEVVLSVKESRGLQIVTSAALIDGFLEIKEDLNKTAFAFAILELIHKLFRISGEVQKFFQYTISVLKQISRAKESKLSMYFGHFLFRISEELGFGWAIEKCLICEKVPRQFPVYLNSQNGGVICSACVQKIGVTGLALNAGEWTQLLNLSSSPINAIQNAENKIEKSRWKEIVGALVHHLSVHTEGEIELKSLNWYQ